MSPRNAWFVLLTSTLSFPACAAHWTATFDQVGPLKIGMRLEAVNHALGEHLSAPAIPTQDPNNECFTVQPAHHPAIDLMVIDGRLARVDVNAPGAQTAKKLQVGATEKAVLAAYGTRAHMEPATNYVKDPNHKSITVLSDNGRYGLLFMIDHGKITEYRLGTAKAVQYEEGCL